MENLNLSASRGVAVREVTLERGHGEADYLLFVDGKATPYAGSKNNREDTFLGCPKA